MHDTYLVVTGDPIRVAISGARAGGFTALRDLVLSEAW